LTVFSLSQAQNDSMNTSKSSYAEKVDSILAIIQSYDQQEPHDSDAESPLCNAAGSGSSNSNADSTYADTIECSNDTSIAHAAELARQIQQRVSGMKLQIESATIQIDLLHGLRMSEEQAHLSAMKSLKEKWKQVFEDAEAKHDQAIDEQTRTNENLANQHEVLMKKEASLKLSLERVISVERDTCKKLQEDGAKELEKAKSNWLYSENNEIRKREQKLIPKIKRDAAKMVELKLRKLSEKHKDEIRSLERETARELESYKLELYRNSRKICKNERRQVEATEKRLIDSIEQEWSLKIEDARMENHREMTALKQSHEETMESLRKQHERDKERRLQQHDIDLKEAMTLKDACLAQQRLSNDCELKALEDKFDKEITLRKAMIQE
jgi:hypothetical protein